MITNLFSLFDPTLRVFSSSWMVFLVLVILPGRYWFRGQLFSFYSYLTGFLKNEVDYVIYTANKGLYILLSSIFLFVVSFNFLALFPFFFSLTSHLSVTLPLAYGLWFGVIIFIWVKSFWHFLAHLVPVGTPLGLISFMSLVELLRNFIRPLALTFRLTANIIAGHLLMSLVGGALVCLSFKVILLGSLVQSLLVLMELGVSVIQAYVFSTLMLLYISEGY